MGRKTRATQGHDIAARSAALRKRVGPNRSAAMCCVYHSLHHAAVKVSPPASAGTRSTGVTGDLGRVGPVARVPRAGVEEVIDDGVAAAGSADR